MTGSGDAIRIFAGTWAGQVLELDVRTGAVRTVVSGVAGPVYALRVHDPFLYCGSGDGRIGLYNVRTGALLESWSAHDGAVTDICELIQEASIESAGAAAGGTSSSGGAGTPEGPASRRTSSRGSIDGSCAGAVSGRAAADAAAARALVAAAAAAAVWTPPETAAPSSSEGLEDDDIHGGSGGFRGAGVHGGAGAHAARSTRAADNSAAAYTGVNARDFRVASPAAALASGSHLRLEKLYAEPEVLCAGLRQRSKRVAADSPADTRLVTCSYDGRIKVWAALPSRALLADIQAHRGPVWSIACAGSTLFSASADGTVKAWRPAAAAPAAVFDTPDAATAAGSCTASSGGSVSTSAATSSGGFVLRTSRTPSPNGSADSRGASPLPFLAAAAAASATSIGIGSYSGSGSSASSSDSASAGAAAQATGDGSSVAPLSGFAGIGLGLDLASSAPSLQSWECAWTACPSGGSAFRKQVMCLRLAGDALFAGTSDGAVMLLRASTGQLCWRVALGSAPTASSLYASSEHSAGHSALMMRAPLGSAASSAPSAMTRTSSGTTLASAPAPVTVASSAGAARDGVRRLDLIRDRLYACTSRGAVVGLAFAHPLLPGLAASRSEPSIAAAVSLSADALEHGATVLAVEAVAGLVDVRTASGSA